MKRLKSLLLVVCLTTMLSACEFSVYKLPLPGGAQTGDDPIKLTVQFADVLDLVPHSTVKVNEVTVGKVTDVSLEGYTAEVTLEVRNDLELPDNAVAEIRQTSLLGEKFVELAAPEGGGTGRLESGDEIPLERSGRNPEVEEVLGALSLLLNGGGVAQLNTITKELNQALEGREGAAKSVLRQISSFMEQLDDNKADIVSAIENLNRLAVEVRQEQPTIDAALEELPSALDSIDRQRGDLVDMLQALNELGAVGTEVIAASKASTIESLRLLNPVLSQLAASGDDFTKAFHVFLTYPFVDEVVGRDPQVARNLHMGDYTNLSILLDLKVGGNQPTLPTNLPTAIDPTVILDNLTRCLRSGDLDSRACRRLMQTPEQILALQEECKKARNEDKDVCRELNSLPGLPGAPGGGGGGGGGLPIPVPIPGLGRAPAGEQRADAGPTFGQLMETYDPALVSLLVPGMVVPR